MGAFLLKYRFFILCLILFVLMVFQAINGQWGGDFWEHAAVVRELATHPLSPVHPILLSDAPHSFYSPYALGIALIARTTGLDAVTTFSVAGVVNLTVFLFSLGLFVSVLFPENREATSFYALLFILFLWGMSQYSASGFFNLLSLSYTLPYPSTFAASMVFMALAMWIWLVRDGHVRWIIPIAAVSGVVLLSHPLTYIFLAVGLVAILVAEQPRLRPALWLMMLVFAASLLAAAVWPYYPFFKMILFDPAYNNYLKTDSVCFYQSIPYRVLPALIGVPVIIWRMRVNWRDPLGLMFVMLVSVYMFGAMFEQWTFGRVLSPIVLILQISLAASVARVESSLDYKSLSPSVQRGVYCLIIVFFSLACSAWYFPHILQRSMPDSPSVRIEFAFLSRFIPQYDVVLSNFNTKLIIPTFGGKIVASDRPLAFVPDLQQRRQDVNDFFSSKSDNDARLAIARKYGCRHILLSKGNGNSPEIIRSFLPLGSVAYEDKEFLLLSLALDHIRPDSSGMASFDRVDAPRN
jgi:hypothetical protein